ncbi:ATP-binding protein [Polaromonas sp.]|uniref:ATP-binding protein n=1 Tax=Polaromonas sp. TaxID=1869339 RepID=UPI0013B9BA83|nr:ATP-binding protein [Polaromonas sp.]NDP63520.1 ATP-binding protein [Polaromonas sp.]
MQKNQTQFAPKSFEDFVISNPRSREKLNDIFNADKPFPGGGKNAICLWGTYGTGKTTLAMELPKLLEESRNMPVIHNSPSILSSSRFWELTKCGEENVTTIIQGLNNRIYQPALSQSGWRYEIFDEIDVIDIKKGQPRLKSAMTHSENTVFIFTTNHPDKLDRGIIDRSHLIEMNQAPVEHMADLAEGWMCAMGLSSGEIDRATLIDMAKESRGSFRYFLPEVQTAVNRYLRTALSNSTN